MYNERTEILKIIISISLRAGRFGYELVSMLFIPKSEKAI